VPSNLNLEELSYRFFVLFNQSQQSSFGPYLKIILIVALCFLLVLVMARTRRIFIEHALHGGVFGIVIGIILMLIVDLIVIAGLSDKSKLQKITSGEAGPEVMKEIAFSGMTNLSRVLGSQTIISARKVTTAQELINDFLGLPDEEAAKVRDLLCPPD
jgi:hypothetical protein